MKYDRKKKQQFVLNTTLENHKKLDNWIVLNFEMCLADTANLTGPRTLADKRWVGPVKLLCIIMFDISKIRPKSILGPVKAQKFSQCLVWNNIWAMGISEIQNWLLVFRTSKNRCFAGPMLFLMGPVSISDKTSKGAFTLGVILWRDLR